MFWNVEDWKNVVFTDETTIRLDAPGKKRILCKRGEEYHPKNIMSKKSGKKISVMFWGAIGCDKKLGFLNIVGNVNQKVYLKLMKKNAEK